MIAVGLRPRAKDYAGAVGIVAVALAIGFGLQQVGVHPANFALVFLTAVLVTAIIFGLWPALVACLLSLLAYNFFFLPPLYTFLIADRSNLVTLFFFGIVAVVGSNLTARVRRQNAIVETERLRSAMLTSLSHDLRTPLASILGAASSLRAQRDSVLSLNVAFEDKPFVLLRNRALVSKLGKGFFEVKLRFGFFETPDVPRALTEARAQGLALDVDHATTFFLGRETLVASSKPSLPHWRIWLYMWLASNALAPARFFRLPPNRVVELGAQVAI